MHKPKLLYIEDNRLNAQLVQKYLKHLDVEVFIAEDGLSGIGMALQQAPDLILMDINLPDINGFEATLRIREYPQIQHTPIVAITSDPSNQYQKRALDVGMDGYLSKPISGSRLLKTVYQFLPILSSE